MQTIEPTVDRIARPEWLETVEVIDDRLKVFRYGIDEETTDLLCPEASEVMLWASEVLCRLAAPMATRVDAESCHELREIMLPRCEVLRLESTEYLTQLVLPEAVEIDVSWCGNLRSIIAPKCRVMRLRHLRELREVIAPGVTDGECIDCPEFLPDSDTARVTFAHPGRFVIEYSV